MTRRPPFLHRYTLDLFYVDEPLVTPAMHLQRLVRELVKVPAPKEEES